MLTRLVNVWRRLRDSLWFLPALMSGAAIGLALVAHRLDRLLAASTERWFHSFFYSGDLEGARALLSTVAGSMITVAGVTFSVTVVALSMASSQFGPRLLVNFMRDRGNQLVLGTFIATFLYCLVALGRAGLSGDVVPSASATAGLLLAVASVALFIYFIHHVASSIRAEHVVDVVARDVACSIERLFPDAGEEAAEADEESASEELDWSAAGSVCSDAAGYVQAIDEPGLVAVGSLTDVVIRLWKRPGHFVVAGEPLAAVLPGERLDAELEAEVRSRLILGRHRTDEQDPEYGIHQLVEVAVRALSPGVNDPHTAISCVDWLSSILCRVAGSRLRSPRRRDANGDVRLVVDPVSFDGMLRESFDQIRQNACATPSVSIRVLEALAAIAREVRRPERAEAVMRQAEMLLAGANDARFQKQDQQALEERYRAVAEALVEVSES